MIKETSQLKACISRLCEEKGQMVGFIPTMGALHQGHLSLVNQCKLDGHIGVCSIFVNPTQFNQAEDFDKYPRHVAADVALLEAAGCDVVFHPEPATMYPNGFVVKEQDYGALTHSLEGFFRPGHFDGVIAIVSKLLEAVGPAHLYMGQKDYQQCAVIAELLRRSFSDIQLHHVSTVREESGLAMSSRNARLSAAERHDAQLIYDTLCWVANEKQNMSLDELKAKAMLRLNEKLRTEYVEIADPVTLKPLSTLSPNQQAVCLIAAWCGDIRLIDNLIIG